MRNKSILLQVVILGVLLVSLICANGYFLFQSQINNAKLCNILLEPVSILAVGTEFGNIESYSIGSGVVVSENGLVIVSKHSVADANYVQVTLQNGDVFEVTNWECDNKYDMAFFLIPDVNGLPYAEIGDSNDLESGDRVFSVGEYRGVWSNWVSVGKVYEPHFKRLAFGKDVYYILVDSSVATGCSGGGLYKDGLLVGIVIAIIEDGTLCVPSNEIKRMLNNYKEVLKSTFD